MSGDGASLQKKEKREKDRVEWTSKPVMIEVASSLDNDRIQKVDLILTLERGKNFPTNPSDENVFWFPSQKSFEDIRGMIVKSCQEAGYAVRLRGKRETSKVIVRMFICPHGRCAQLKGESQRSTQTDKPVDGEPVCPFYFSLWEVKKNGRICIPKQQKGNKIHKGHNLLPSEDVSVRTESMQKEDLAVAISLLEENLAPSAVRDLTMAKTGVQLSIPQIKGLRKKLRQSQREEVSAMSVIATEQNIYVLSLMSIDRGENYRADHSVIGVYSCKAAAVAVSGSIQTELGSFDSAIDQYYKNDYYIDNRKKPPDSGCLIQLGSEDTDEGDIIRLEIQKCPVQSLEMHKGKKRKEPPGSDDTEEK